MIQLALDPSRAAVAVAGRGGAAGRRAERLARGAVRVTLFTDMPASTGALPENVVLREGLPDAAAFSAIAALWIAGLERAEAERLAAAARAARVLVNVEDVPALCDFHSVAEVRRGDLLIGISTGGRSPGLAARVRGWIEAAFGPEWAERTATLGARRVAWRAQGLGDLAARTQAAINATGWLP